MINSAPINRVSVISTYIYMLIIVIICNIIRNNYYSHFAKCAYYSYWRGYYLL